MKILLTFLSLFSIAQAQDTVPVRLLISDTSVRLHITTKEYECNIIGCTVNHFDIVDTVYQTDASAKWVKAYSVRKWDVGNQMVNNINRYRPVGWVHSHYLDILKRPLGENIVVWLSK